MKTEKLIRKINKAFGSYMAASSQIDITKLLKLKEQNMRLASENERLRGSATGYEKHIDELVSIQYNLREKANDLNKQIKVAKDENASLRDRIKTMLEEGRGLGEQERGVYRVLIRNLKEALKAKDPDNPLLATWFEKEK